MDLFNESEDIILFKVEHDGKTLEKFYIVNKYQ